MGLLDRAKQMLQGRPAAPPQRSQYYRVACAEGHVLHGQRTEGYQALRCPVCDEGIFVLPRSPLPEPAAPASGSTRPAPARPTTLAPADDLVLADPPSPGEIARARAAQGTGVPGAPDEPNLATNEVEEAEIEWMDEAEPAPAAAPEPARARTKPNPTARPKAAGTPKPAPAPAPAPARAVEATERPDVGAWFRRHKNPLVFATVALVAVATVGLRIRQNWLAKLPKVVEIGRTEGLAKLDLGEFNVAKTLLGEAARAARALGGSVDGADEVIQGAIEAALLADRCTDSLSEILEKAEAYNPPEAWAAYFDSVYRGRAIVVQATVTAVPDPARPDSRYDLDYRVYHGKGSTPRGKARLDLNGFRLIEGAEPKVGDVLTFGARLASLRVDTIDAANGERTIGLVPDSGAFITHQKVVELIFPRDEPEAEPAP